jgi:hypothetical protein
VLGLSLSAEGLVSIALAVQHLSILLVAIAYRIARRRDSATG